MKCEQCGTLTSGTNLCRVCSRAHDISVHRENAKVAQQEQAEKMCPLSNSKLQLVDIEKNVVVKVPDVVEDDCTKKCSRSGTRL